MRKIIITLSLLILCACNPNNTSSSDSTTTIENTSTIVRISSEDSFSNLSSTIIDATSSPITNSSSFGGLVDGGQDKDSGFGQLYG